MAVFNNRTGDQTYRGTDGEYDQVDYTGQLTDYTFTRNDDGSVTVSHPTLGTDRLISIEGFWFSGEAAWYSLDDAIALTAGDDTGYVDANGVITGNDSDNALTGSNQNDLFYGGRGDDILDGNGGGYNQGEYDGALIEYTFTRNNDGSVTMSHPTWGTDTLIDIDGLWFMREQAWYSLDDAITITQSMPEFRLDDDNVLNGTPGNDIMNAAAGGTNFYGGTGNDRFNGRNNRYDQVNYDGDVEDYTITDLGNGNYRFSHPVWGVDTLNSIDGLWFGGRGEWYTPEQAFNLTRNNADKANIGDAVQIGLGSDFLNSDFDDFAPLSGDSASTLDPAPELPPLDTAEPFDADFDSLDTVFTDLFA